MRRTALPRPLRARGTSSIRLIVLAVGLSAMAAPWQDVTVTLVDERYSSAVLQARRGEIIDAKAAAVILQQYFDSY